MARQGRRPGDPNTRETIVEAAAHTFAEQGYDATTIRAVARAAAVDPALVYHYFGDKAGLFVSAFRLPVDPRQVQLEAQVDGGISGARVIERFLAQWERDPADPGKEFRTMVEAVGASPEVARTIRQFLTERVWTAPEGTTDLETWSVRRALVSSQLVGAAWARYILQVEPLASASREQVARWIGPTIDRYLAGDVSG